MPRLPMPHGMPDGMTRGMTRGTTRGACVALAALLLAGASPVRAQNTDAEIARVQRLVNAGDRAAARMLADSLVARYPEGTSQYADALYAQAFAASGAADAERDYLRLSVEYPLSPRAEDALMMLAQLRLARGDRAGARRSFERLVRDHPTGAQVAKASLWAGRLALEDGDAALACPALRRAHERVSPDDVELKNQVEYYVQRCAAVAATPVRDTAMRDTTARDTIMRAAPPVAPPPQPEATPLPPAPRRERPAAPRAARAAQARAWSVQVAAFPEARNAEALAEVLAQRGYSVRVVGTKAPFRVRVGRYESREAATAALGRMKAARVNGYVVEAEPQ